MFFICSHCDHGQVYCSSGCREATRRLQLRAANLRHQQSEEGRLDHRDRQRAYRRRLARSATPSAAQSVTDHGSKNQDSHDIVGAAPSDDSELVDLDTSLIQPVPRGHLSLSRSGIVCSCCGRLGVFINPFHDLE
jgi:hypothetical protein